MRFYVGTLEIQCVFNLPY